MKEKITVTFDILAGTYDSDGVSYKYCDTADNLPEALHKYSNTQGYQYRELEMIIECDGDTSRVYMFGGPMLELRMRMEFANLWVIATGNKFVDVAMNWEKQVEDIALATRLLHAEATTRRKRCEGLVVENRQQLERINRDREIKDGQQAAIDHLREENDRQYHKIHQLEHDLANANYALANPTFVSWQDVYSSFEAGEFTWTEAFEALMNKCGFSMEDALKCLAENFDRRPTIAATEVSDADS